MKIKGKKHKGITLAAVYDWDNLLLADAKARKGKRTHYGVRKFDQQWWQNMTEIQHSIEHCTYRHGTPKIQAQRCEGKIRRLAKVKYYDLVVEHAFMQVIAPVLNRSYYYESSASITDRGIHYAARHVRRYIDRNKGHPLWWVQLDFIKCYHHVRRQRLYERFCREFSDEGIRYLCREVVFALGNHNGLAESNGEEGVGIGLYPIQPLFNFYLNDLDRMVAAVKGVKYYRYADNLMLIGDSPQTLREGISLIQRYASDCLQQPLHGNVGIQRLDEVHPIDFVGYLFYPHHTLVRKETKYRFKKKYKHTQDDSQLPAILSSYKGWLMNCDGLHLWQTVTGMKRFSELNIKRTSTTRNGQVYFDVPTVSCSFLVNREITVKDFQENVNTKNGDGRFVVLVEENGRECKFITNNPHLKDCLRQIREMDELPFVATYRSRSLGGSKVDYYFE